MSYHIDVQHACHESIPFADEQLIHWALLPVTAQLKSAELTLRLVEIDEMKNLNHSYRQQNKETNVLAFPSSLPDNIELDFPLLGDVIICPAVLKEESLWLDKPLQEHWAHIIIHGVLHLLGYDHIKESDTEIMQELEKKLLAELGFADPYQIEGDNVE